MVLCIFSLVACSPKEHTQRENEEPITKPELTDVETARVEAKSAATKYLNEKYNLKITESEIKDCTNVTITNEDGIAKLLEEEFITQEDIDAYEEGSLSICTPHLCIVFSDGNTEDIYYCVVDISDINKIKCYDNYQTSKIAELMWGQLPITLCTSGNYNIVYNYYSKELHKYGIDEVLPNCINEKITAKNFESLLDGKSYPDIAFEIDYFVEGADELKDLSKEVETLLENTELFGIYNCSSIEFSKQFIEIDRNKNFLTSNKNDIVSHRLYGRLKPNTEK